MVCRRALATTPKTGGSFKVQDDKDFVDKVENSKEPVIVDFFATYVMQKSRFTKCKINDFRWCGPCKALEPRLENVIAQRKGDISVAKVDIDDLGELAAKYEVKRQFHCKINAKNCFFFFRLAPFQLWWFFKMVK